MQTPLRGALRADSQLQRDVKTGLGALRDTSTLHEDIRRDFADSLDLDSALQAAHPNDPRWDYLLGHAPSRTLIGVEVHPATSGEVTVIIAKKQAAQCQLQRHLRDGKTVARWIWVASGAVAMLDIDKARRRLDQNGVAFAGRELLARHLLR